MCSWPVAALQSMLARRLLEEKLHGVLKEPLKNGVLQALSVGIFLVFPPRGIINF